MGRKTIIRQLEHCLHEKIAFGESRHNAKNELRNTLGEEYRFGMSDKKIHSIETFDTYKKVAKEYTKWLIEEKGLNKYIDIKETEQFAKEYIQYRIDCEKSLWTIKWNEVLWEKFMENKSSYDNYLKDKMKILQGQEKNMNTINILVFQKIRT